MGKASRRKRASADPEKVRLQLERDLASALGANGAMPGFDVARAAMCALEAARRLYLLGKREDVVVQMALAYQYLYQVTVGGWEIQDADEALEWSAMLERVASVLETVGQDGALEDSEPGGLFDQLQISARTLHQMKGEGPEQMARAAHQLAIGLFHEALPQARELPAFGLEMEAGLILLGARGHAPQDSPVVQQLRVRAASLWARSERRADVASGVASTG